MGFSARSADDYHETREKLADRLVPVALPLQAEDRVREVQAALVARGQHRTVSVPDLLIAATAEVEGLTVLHYDADFDLTPRSPARPASGWSRKARSDDQDSMLGGPRSSRTGG
jgi:predicted nucleic acid-binding protein